MNNMSRVVACRSRAAALAIGLFASFALAGEAGSSQDAPSDETAKRLGQARALYEKGSLSEARKLYESLVPGLQLANRRVELASVLAAVTEIASSQGEYEVAIAKGHDSAELHHQLGDKNGEARALNSMGKAQVYRGEYSAALAQFQSALALYLDSGNPEGETEQLSNIGGVYYYQGKYMDAWRWYRKALDRVDRAGHEPWIARRRQIAMHNLATLYQRLGRTCSAMPG